MSQDFDTQLQDLYEQLANTQPQVEQRVIKNLISNAAYEQIKDLEIERLQIIKKNSPSHPSLAWIDSKKAQLGVLINRNKI